MDQPRKSKMKLHKAINIQIGQKELIFQKRWDSMLPIAKRLSK